MKPSNKITAGIIGAAGYTGGELMRLLLNHPNVELSFIHSNSQSGKTAAAVHHDLLGACSLTFTHTVSFDVDVLFLCLGHGESKKFLTENKLPASLKIIDLSQDFRPGWALADGKHFVYGLSESLKNEIRQATCIANPGCFATCIQLALLPLVKHGLLNSPVHIHATTGSTGAGKSLGDTAHFSWRSNNLSIYKAFEHQHLKEMYTHAEQYYPGNKTEYNFIPARGAFTRGIFSSLYTTINLLLKEAEELYQSYYAESPFVWLAPFEVDLKQVVNTNNCFIHLEQHGHQLLITSAIDNLLKGASGQAVQNLNLMMGWDETTGLKLKASNF